VKPQQDSQEATQPPPSPEEKLALAQAEEAKWRQVAASPNLPPKAAAWALDMAMSAQAEARLRQKGLAYRDAGAGQVTSANPRDQTSDEAMAQVLGMGER
jgi:hypothetical protein